MSIVRHEQGPFAVARGLASQVHPVFMLPPVAASLVGAVLAPAVGPLPAAIHVLATFCALYTAHVRDGYVDFHVRGEDDDHPLTAAGCHLALAAATVGFLACTVALWILVGPLAALVTAPGWLVGATHAPWLDVTPLGATVGYPAGVTLALVGGHYVQAGTVLPAVAVLAVVVLLVLSGIKIVDDATDVVYDRSIGKRTVAAVLGIDAARRVAAAAMVAGLVLTTVVALVTPVFPPGGALAAVAFAAVGAVATRAPPALATELLIRGAYVFLAVLLAAVWLRPFA